MPLSYIKNILKGETTMRKTNKVYLVTWSYPGGAWNVVRAYVDTKAQARKAAKDQFGSGIEIHDIELWEN